MKRRIAREKAVQCLFQIDMADVQLRDAVEMVTDGSGEDVAYMLSLVNGAMDNQAAIDEEIGKFLRGWKLDRIANVDRAILRLAFYELMYETEVPKKVIVNEAIELAKLFSDDQSYRFVNGVLSSYLQETEHTRA